MNFNLKLKISFIFLLFTFIAFPLKAQNGTGEPELAWPREITTDNERIIIYQPQMESFQGDVLEARAAFSVTTGQNNSPVFGAVWLKSLVEIDRENRLVTPLTLEVINAKFPSGEKVDIEKFNNLLKNELPKWNLVISLDDFLAALSVVEENQKIVDQSFNNEPPEIIFATSPTVLVMIDGNPRLSSIEKTDLDYVINTPYSIFYDKKTGDYYLKGGEIWYRSADVLGKWENIDSPSSAVISLIKQTDQDNPPEPLPEVNDSLPTVVPDIMVRTHPAELIQTDGEPVYSPIEGTALLYLQNSENDVIMDIQSQKYYVLLAGRWYASPSLSAGPWTFVPFDQLPEDFPEIPANSDVADVRTSIPGTEEAREAVLENQIPQTAEIDRNESKLKVDYDGEPKFIPIDGTNMAYAVNTDKSVIQIDNRFYCCDQAVWFESVNPHGPWEVSVSIPADVKSIPPESPVYHVKYVEIYHYTPSVVYVGYTPGYTHSYRYGPVVVYGTGWHYPPWYGHYYYPKPVTYGFGVHYNFYTGWGFSYGVSYGWMYIGIGTWRPPYYGWWGPAGYYPGYRHGYHRGYHHGYRAGARAGYRAGSQNVPYRNIYRNQSARVRSTADKRPRAQQSARTGKTTVPGNNVFTDRNGNIYQKNDKGWQKRENGRWDDVQKATPDKKQPPSSSGKDQKPLGRPGSNQNRQPSQMDRQNSTPNLDQLNREYQSRDRGNKRTRDYQSNQRTNRNQSTGRQSPPKPQPQRKQKR
ncbi:MAG: hypothetical protein P8Y60_06845 [Calditrichota bacterium]